MPNRFGELLDRPQLGALPARPALRRRRYFRTAAAFDPPTSPDPRWLAVIVVADTVVAAIGIAGDMQWRFFEAMIFDRPAKAVGPVVRSTANVVVLACPNW
jgi:hypothetical protein